MAEQPDIVQVFKDAWEEADKAGLEGSRSEHALKKVLKTISWEIHDMGLPQDAYSRRAVIARHVLHRAGEQHA